MTPSDALYGRGVAVVLWDRSTARQHVSELNGKIVPQPPPPSNRRPIKVKQQSTPLTRLDLSRAFADALPEALLTSTIVWTGRANHGLVTAGPIHPFHEVDGSAHVTGGQSTLAGSCVSGGE